MRISTKIRIILSAVLLLATLAGNTAPDMTVYKGTSRNYYVTPNDGSTYTWDIDGLDVTDPSNSSTVLHFWNTLGEFTLSVVETQIRNDKPCVGDIKTLVIEVKEPDVIYVEAETGRCEGENITYTVSPAITIPDVVYEWTVNSLTYSTDEPKLTQTAIAGTSNISVKAVSSAGTTNTATTTAFVKATPKISLLVTGDNVCLGYNLEFTADGSFPTYTWNVNGSTITTTSKVYTYTTETTGDVPATVIVEENGCYGDDSATGHVVQVEKPEVVSYSYCAEEGMIRADALVTSTNPVVWYSNKITSITISPPVINKQATSLNTYFVATRSGSCESERVQLDINIYPNPVVVERARINDKNVEITVAEGLPPYVLYEAQNTISSPFFETTNITSNVSGKVYFTIVDSREGLNCSTSDSIIFKFNDIAPETHFSPNGDGINDLWNIHLLNCNEGDDENTCFSNKYPRTEITIYDRYGKKLAYYKGADFKGWSGISNGRLMISDDYWYTIYIPELGERMSGHFNLRR